MLHKSIDDFLNIDMDLKTYFEFYNNRRVYQSQIETSEKCGLSFRPKGEIFDSDKISQSLRSFEMTFLNFLEVSIKKTLRY